AAAGVVLFLMGPTVSLSLRPATAPAPAESESETLTILEKTLTPEQVTHLEVRKGDRVVTLDRGPQGTWTMPGGWPTRPSEVKGLVELVTGLRSRFTPFAVNEATDLKTFGLDAPPVTVHVTAAGKTYRLQLAEKESAAEEVIEAGNTSL